MLAASFDYAIVRVVPHVEREEFLNVGVILLARTLRFLGCRVALDQDRLLTLAPDADLEMIQAQLDLIASMCEDSPALGPLADLNLADRFHWLTSPRSTTIQVSPVHSGLCDDPQSALDELFDRLVRPPGP